VSTQAMSFYILFLVCRFKKANFQIMNTFILNRKEVSKLKDLATK